MTVNVKKKNSQRFPHCPFDVYFITIVNLVAFDVTFNVTILTTMPYSEIMLVCANDVQQEVLKLLVIP